MKILTVTLNPAFDIIGSIDRLVLGEVNTASPLGFIPGGKGVNVAKVLANLGLKPVVTGFYGADNKSDFDQLFEQLEITNCFFPVSGKTRTNIKLTEKDDTVTDINFPGFAVNQQQWLHFRRHLLEMAKDYDFIVISGSLPEGIKPRKLNELIKHLNKEHHKVILDTSNAALIAGVEAQPWLIKPNKSELEGILGHRLEGLEELVNAAYQIQKKGVANIIISLGEEGSIWVGENNLELRAYPPKIKNLVTTVGAGDTMIAGFFYSLAQGYSPRQTLTFATAISAYSVTRTSAGIDDIDALLPYLEETKVLTIEEAKEKESF